MDAIQRRPTSRKFLVSVHVPKTAGTSLLAEIKRGALGRPLLDYDDRHASRGSMDRLRRICSAATVRLRSEPLLRDYDVVHGHFHVNKYSFLRSRADLLIFMREPVARTLSAYYYLKYTASRNPHTARRNALIPLIASGRLDLVEFAWDPHLQHIYRDYLAGTRLADFVLVGISERYGESIAVLNRLYNVALTELHERRSDYIRYENEYRALLPELRRANSENTEIYQLALECFERRRSEVLG